MLIKIWFYLIVWIILFKDYEFNNNPYEYFVPQICTHSFINRTTRTISSYKNDNKEMVAVSDTNKNEDHLKYGSEIMDGELNLMVYMTCGDAFQYRPADYHYPLIKRVAKSLSKSPIYKNYYQYDYNQNHSQSSYSAPYYPYQPSYHPSLDDSVDHPKPTKMECCVAVTADN